MISAIVSRQAPTKCIFFCHQTSPGIVPLQSHPPAGAERPRCEIEVDCPQGEAHLDQGASSQFTWDLGSGKHTGRQILQKMDEHKKDKSFNTLMRRARASMSGPTGRDVEQWAKKRTVKMQLVCPPILSLM